MIQAEVEAEPPTLGTEVFIDKGCQVDELINPYICLSCVCVCIRVYVYRFIPQYEFHFQGFLLLSS